MQIWMECRMGLGKAFETERLGRDPNPDEII
jgi:hypothetical protein